MGDYPTNKELFKIRKWNWKDLNGLMDYIKPLWMYADCGYWEQTKDGEYWISTGGWSGNENIILAMQHNYTWWSRHWWSETTGGHFVFKDVFKNIGE